MNLSEAFTETQLRTEVERPIGMSTLGTEESDSLIETFRDRYRSAVQKLVLSNPNRRKVANGRLLPDVDEVLLWKQYQRLMLLLKRNDRIRRSTSVPPDQREPYVASLAQKIHHDPFPDFFAIIETHPDEYHSLRRFLTRYKEFRDDEGIRAFYEIISKTRPLYRLLPPFPLPRDGEPWVVPTVLKKLAEELDAVPELLITGTLHKHTELMRERLDELGFPRGVSPIGRPDDLPHSHIDSWKAAVASLVGELVPDEVVLAFDNVRYPSEHINRLRLAGHPSFQNVVGLHFTQDPDELSSNNYSINWNNAYEVVRRFIRPPFSL